MKKQVSKGVTSLLAASLICTGVTWTSTTASAASPFKDVKPGWAEKHITKLALQGILKGGTGKSAGTFNPSSQVTRQDAVLIALRFMGVADEVKPSDVLVFPSVMSMKEDYKPVIKLALQKKLLLIEEEAALAEEEAAAAAKENKVYNWGSTPASREWITKLLVRAIGLEEQAKLAESQATSFTDDAQIDTKLKGYVNVAVTSGLVTGVGSSGAKFDPLGAVTREMVSTLFSRAESKLSVAYSGQVVGTLMSIAADKVTLRHQDGVVKEYSVSPTAAIYGYKSEQTGTIASLVQYGEVVLISNSDGTIGYIEQTSETANVKNYEGMLTSVVEAEGKVTVQIAGESKTFFFDTLKMPTIKDSSGQSLTLANVPVNVPVKLSVEAVSGDGKILTFTVNQVVINKSGAGTITAWNPATASIQVKDASGKSENFPVSDKVTIKHNNVDVPQAEMIIGDVISYEVKNGIVTSIVISKKMQPPVVGLVVGVNKDKKTIQYTVNNKLEADFLVDNVAVKIEGLSGVSLDDVFENDSVSLTFDDNGKVATITVMNRSVSFLTSATIKSYYAADKILIVEDSNKKSVPLVISNTTRFDMNGTKMTLAEIEKFIIVGKKINVGYTGTSVAYVSVVSQYTGTVVENNTTARTLKLAVDGSGTITLPYSTYAPAVEIYGQNFETFVDVRVGDRITAIMDFNTQEQVIIMNVQKTVQFEFVSADVSTNKLRAKRADGVIEEWNMSSASIALQDESGAAISLNALNQTNATLLNISFNGNSPTKVKAVATTYGRVSSVNTSASSLDLVTNTGTVVTKTFTTAPIVMKENVNIGSLSNVKPDDRVEILRDENDKVVIHVIPALRRTVQFSDSYVNKLYVFKPTINDPSPTSYVLHPQVYIHQGTTTLTLSNLVNKDVVSLYIVRGNLIEIAK